MKATYGYNSNNLTRNNKPWLPVMGEMHYSRYSEKLWEESLRKIKAGGVSIVSVYVIWIHHEEEEGVFDFSGCRDIQTFLMLCKKVGLSVFLRLGPFVHGEVRNGGLPDWVLQKEKEGMQIRSNDQAYLKYVYRYWKAVYEQVRYCIGSKDSPLLGVQIENEYGHVGGLRGIQGESHMRMLTAMAKEIGFEASYYTATGWGGACIGDLLPVMGGYCEAPWDPRTCEIEPNNNFVFSHTRNDKLIACDHNIESENSYDENKFPYLTAELGGGLQVTSHRRPVANGKDIGAMSTVKLGSGAGLLGYYMYHGGSNPKGKFSTLQESRATGYCNDLPEINYDFNGPIKQYGTISDTYKEIKLLAYFLNDFGEDMAQLKAEIPDTRITPDNLETIRYTCRHDADHGYVFFNNYQRRWHMKEHPDVVLEGLCGEFDESHMNNRKNSIVFPKFTLKDGMYGFFPYRMKLNDAILHTALATPLCEIKTKNESTFVFYGDQEPQFTWENDKAADVIFLSREDAKNAYKVTLDQDYLVLSDNFVWEESGKMLVTGPAHTKVLVYPEPENGIEGFIKCSRQGRFTAYERTIEQEKTKAEFKRIFKAEDKPECTLVKHEDDKAVYEIMISYPEFKLPKDQERLNGHDVLLSFEFAGERMELFLGDEKINDYFYTGQTVLLSLGYFTFPQNLTAVISPLHETDPVFLEKKPEFIDGCACSLENVVVEELFR